MTTQEAVLIRGARLLDPSAGVDQEGDILLVDGRIHQIGGTVRDGDVPPGCHVIPGAGLLTCPGFIDLHTHLRDPGYEHKETVATGVMAAARGGFTTICCMPNTNPPMDTVSVVEYVLRRAREANGVRVLPIGCVTKGRAGKELAEMWELAQAGVVAFSDDGSPVSDVHLMRQALTYTKGLGLPVINHCQDMGLAQGGVVNEGWVSGYLGLRAWPPAAEEVMAARDIALAELTGGRLHLAHLSTAGSVELVRCAKERGVPVTAEVAPHHLTLDEAWVLGHGPDGALTGHLTAAAYDTYAKVNPPLRTQKDIEALVAGLRDGVIDAVATDHAPHAITDKMVTFDEAEFGISGLETAVGALLGLVHRGDLSMKVLVERLTAGPVGVLGDKFKHLGTLRQGAPADVVLIDPQWEWTVKAGEFASKGKNTPLEGVTLKGRVMVTIAEGRLVYSGLPQHEEVQHAAGGSGSSGSRRGR